MTAAARLGDVTSHGGTIAGPGVATVLIGGMPAAVVGDLHACALPPASGHPNPSVFPSGSSSVLIGGRPALRTGDACLCGAMAVIGAPTVILG